MKPTSGILSRIFFLLLLLTIPVSTSYAIVKIDITYSSSQIEIKWNSQGTGSQVQVYRRVLGDVGAATWTLLGTVSYPTLNYIDNTIVSGTTYEYQVIKVGDAASKSYAAAGINVPMVEDRGTILLVVDNTLTTSLKSELKLFEQDMTGDGWTVIRYDSPRAGAGTGETLKTWIKSKYDASPTTVKAVLLFGHLPLIKTGYLAPDGHSSRPHASDLFYADMDGTWTDASLNITGFNIPGDGIFDQSTIPGNNKVEVQISRIDFYGMTAFSATETEMYRNYLSRDHLWRHALKNTPMRGLGGNGYLDIETAVLSSLFGSANVTTGNFSATEQNDYAMAVDFGDWNGGNYPNYKYKIAFCVNFGSYKQNFESNNNMMRAMLCMPEYGLSCVWGSRPNFFFHHMGMGQTVGYSAYRTFNNGNSEYSPACHYYFQGYVHLELVGDLTLRLHNVMPVKNLTATLNSTKVDLKWNKSPHANVGYHIYRANSASGPYTRVTSSPQTDTTYTDASPGTTKVYMVKALKLESSVSGTYYNLSQGVFAEHPSYPVADTIAPTVASNLRYASLGDYSFMLKWDAASDNKGVTSYEVFKDGASIGTTTATSMNITGLNEFTRYAMTVKAKDAAGNVSATSSTLNVRTAVVQSVSGQTYPSQIGDNAINGNLADKWNVGSATAWMVLRYITNRTWNQYEITSAPDSPDRDPSTWTVYGSNDSTTWIILDTQKVQTWLARKETKAYTFTNATAYKYYKWSVTLVNGGTQFQVGEFKFLNTLDSQAPTVPTSLVSSSITPTSFTLSWTASTDNIGVVSYEVFKGGISYGTSITTSLSITGLTPATAYSMTVKAKDAAGNVSAASTALVVTTSSDTQAPTAPTALTSSAITATSFTLSWTASTDNVGVTSYEVFRETTSCGTTASTSLSVTGLTAATAYTMTVKAKDAAGNVSTASTALIVTTLKLKDTQSPTVPTNLKASGITSQSLTLTWNASTDNEKVGGYEVYMNDVLIGKNISTTYDVPGLSASTGYSFAVLAYDTTGNKSARSSKLTVTTLPTSAEAVINAIEIYPNPASNFVTITNLQTGEIVTLYAMDGRIMKTFIAGEDAILLPLDGLEKGIYILCIKGKERPLANCKIIIE